MGHDWSHLHCRRYAQSHRKFFQHRYCQLSWMLLRQPSQRHFALSNWQLPSSESYDFHQRIRNEFCCQSGHQYSFRSPGDQCDNACSWSISQHYSELFNKAIQHILESGRIWQFSSIRILRILFIWQLFPKLLTLSSCELCPWEQYSWLLWSQWLHHRKQQLSVLIRCKV